MPFLQAGFNASNRDTGIRGWTRHLSGGQFAPAELRQFHRGQDFFWFGGRPGKGHFLTWGEFVVLGSHYGFELADEYQYALPRCDLETRREHRDGWWRD